MKDMQKAANYLYPYLQNLSSVQYVPLLAAWRKVIGETYLGHAQVYDVKGSTLLIAVDHPAWIMKLHAEEKRFLDILQEQVTKPKIKRIHFFLREERRYQSAMAPTRSLVRKKKWKKKQLSEKQMSGFTEKVEHITRLIEKNNS